MKKHIVKVKYSDEIYREITDWFFAKGLIQGSYFDFLKGRHADVIKWDHHSHVDYSFDDPSVAAEFKLRFG
jgi:hypothetical protein